jgi:hypothetical protein
MKDRYMKRMLWFKRIVLLLLIMLVVYVTFKYINNVPYFYLGVELFLIMVTYIIIAKDSSEVFKVILINCSSILFCIAACEVYYAGYQSFGFGINDKETAIHERIGNPAFNEITGYSGGVNSKGRSIKTHDGKIVYDFTNTTNQFGLRVSAHDEGKFTINSGNNYKNIVFFGCSFMFGWGINDNETIPYLFEDMSLGKYRTYNFGFGGYGPHQMLRILETGLIDRIITDKKPSVAIYLAVIEHIERSSGKYPYFLWDVNGPKYILNSSKEVEYVGKFNGDLLSQAKYLIFKQLAMSYLISSNSFSKKILNWSRDEEDRDLFINIILKSRELFMNKYKGDFYVIFWSTADKDYDYVLSALKRNNVKLILVDDIFGKYKVFEEKYRINYDGHPTKLAHDKIVEYLVKYFE